jgi:integrase/recombinase XerD
VSAEITLAGAITGLIGEKRALGYKYACEERVLARFEAFCVGEFPGLSTVTQASVEAWIASARRRAVTPATVQGLAAPVRELARWLHRHGVDAYVLPAGVLEKPARYVPYIYSDRELAALFAATDRCHYCSGVPFRHLVMPVLFRTIYACGLRCSEARLPRHARRTAGLGVVLRWRDAGRAVDAQQRQPQLPAVSVAGADPARRPRTRPEGS